VQFHQHAFSVQADLTECRGLMPAADEYLPAGFNPLGEIGMQIHDQFPAETVRTPKKTDHQIYRLA
jgi:hypothetical protein